MGCHFLLQCMKVKSESEVVQSCPTLRDPMDCSPPGSSVHGIFQARVLEWGAIAFSISPAVGANHPGAALASASSLIWGSRLQPPRSLLIHSHDDTASLLGGGAQYHPFLGAVGMVAATGSHLFSEVQTSPPSCCCC